MDPLAPEDSLSQELFRAPTQSSPQKRAQKYFNHLYFIGFGIFFFIIFSLNWPEILSILARIDGNYLVAAFVLQAVSIILTFKRFSVLSSIYERIPFSTIFNASVLGGIYSYFIPANLGEGFKAPIIKEHSEMGYRQIFFIIIFDKLFDIVIALLCGFAGLLFMQTVLGYRLSYLSAAIIPLSLAICIGIIFGSKAIRAERAEKIILKIGALNVDIGGHVTALKQVIVPFFKSRDAGKILFWANAWNIIAYSISFCAIYLLMAAVGVQLNFLVSATVYCIVLLMNMLPITFSGIGTRDFSLIFMFHILGQQPEQAMAVSLLDLAILNYGVFVFLFIIVWACKFFRKQEA